MYVSVNDPHRDRDHDTDMGNIIGNTFSKSTLKKNHEIQVYENLKTAIANGVDIHVYINDLNHYSDILFRYDCVQFALENGYNPNIHRGQPFSWLCYCQSYHAPLKIIQLLLEHGADPHIYTDSGETPLHLVRTREELELYIKYGADINKLTRNFSATPFEYVLSLGRIDVAKAFMKYKPKCVGKWVYIHHQDVFRYWRRVQWKMLYCCVKFLAIHQRAVVTANHPKRLKELGIFECIGEGPSEMSKRTIPQILADPTSKYQRHPDDHLKDSVLVHKDTSNLLGLDGSFWDKVHGEWKIVEPACYISDSYDFEEYVQELCHVKDGHYVYGLF